MDFPPIRSLVALSGHQKSSLERGGFRGVADVLLATADGLSRACRIPPQEASKIIALICQECARPLRSLADALAEAPDEMFTTGDSELDSILGGGIRTGMIWEVVGESAAGKTQLALQLSLTVQLPRELRGLSGDACYITVASQLQTTRLQQILHARPSPSLAACSLEGIHTVQTPTVEKLVYVLSTFLPQYITTSAKPLKLVVIDALAELFHAFAKTTTHTLLERSRCISDISSHLHVFASRHRVAVLVLNEVIDVITYDKPQDNDAVTYESQSRLFGRANSIPGEDKKEASLGLVWANQVNARIFLTRTGRRRYLADRGVAHKRQAGQREAAVTPGEDEPVLIRRLSVVFSSVSSPASCDYIVTAQGFSVVPRSATADVAPRWSPVGTTPASLTTAERQASDTDTSDGKQCMPTSQLNIGCVEDSFAAEGRPPTPKSEHGGDEWEAFWMENDLPDDVYTHLDLGQLPPIPPP